MRTLALALVVAVVPSLALAQPGGDPPVLRVQGSADVRVPADIGVVRLGVVAEADTAQVAQQTANVTIAAIGDALGRVGIAARDIQTTQLMLTPVYADGRPEDRGEPRIRMALQAAPTPVSPGEITVSATVSIEYAIR
jgi:hypothetical protein